jgi:NAD-dependent deacetylase sirtuin 2
MGTLCGRATGIYVPSSTPVDRDRMEFIAKEFAKSKNVVVMVGAGLSVSAGIPDFRTPGTGLYDNLHQYGLPYAEAVFDLKYFTDNPEPFYTLCKELWPGQYEPTLAHYFIALLHTKGMLQRCFTQNIDSLESCAGLPTEKLVAAHGNFDSATCIETGRSVPVDDLREAVMEGKDACLELSRQHGGLVKPDIVFFGENLPKRFTELSGHDFLQCDFLLVMGTSLSVEPFASLIFKVRPGVPRFLINRKRVGEDLGHSPRRVHSPIRSSFSNNRSSGFQFDVPSSNDVFFEGNCDDGVAELIKGLDWEKEFDLLRFGEEKTELTEAV